MVSFDLAALSENVSFQNPTYELSNPEMRQKLATAAAGQTTVEFDYYAQYKQTTERRRVDIYLLHNFGGDWYAIAFDHTRKGMRDFHLGRISNLRETRCPITKVCLKISSCPKLSTEPILGGAK